MLLNFIQCFNAKDRTAIELFVSDATCLVEVTDEKAYY
jgi:hypothetical protein